MRLKTFLLFIFIDCITIILSSEAFGSISISSTSGDVKVESIASLDSGGWWRYDYFITNNSGKNLDFFAVYLYSSDPSAPQYLMHLTWSEEFYDSHLGKIVDALPSSRKTHIQNILPNEPLLTPDRWGMWGVRFTDSTTIEPSSTDTQAIGPNPPLYWEVHLCPAQQNKPVVPAPSALLLLVSGLAGVVGLRRKKLLK